MPDLRVRPHAPDAAGQVLAVSPESAGWDHVGFAVHKLAAGQTASGHEAGREAGADDYLTKPFRPRELRQRVAELAQSARG